MFVDAGKFAHDWIVSWNSHDLDKIMKHYSDDVEVVSPMIKLALDTGAGSLKGKERVRRYWEAAFQKVPDLHFELIDAAQGVNSMAVYYKSVMNKMAVEVMFLNEAGQVTQAVVHYH